MHPQREPGDDPQRAGQRQRRGLQTAGTAGERDGFHPAGRQEPPPAGVSDRRDTTVVDLVRSAYPRRELFPAGRLDKTSTGFVLITDDGGFAHDILAPRRHVPKTYRVTLDTPLTGEMVDGFAAGVVLMDNVRLAPAEVEPLSEDKRTVRVVLHQGVYHQIKRMFGVYGAGVNALHREAIGGVALDEAMAPGQWRELTEAEVAAIAGR